MGLFEMTGMKEKMFRHALEIQRLRDEEYRIFDNLPQVHDFLKKIYTTLPFNNETFVAGPLALSSTYYSTDLKKKQFKVVNLILPDFSQITGEAHQLKALPTINPKKSAVSSKEHNLYHFIKKIAQFTSNFFVTVFDFVKRPLTDARRRTELRLDSIIQEFISLKQSESEWIDKRKDLEQKIKKIKPFWPIKTPVIAAKYKLAFCLAYPGYMHNIFKEDNKKGLLPEDLRLYLYCTQYYKAEQWMMLNCLPDKMEKHIQEAIKRINELRFSSAFKTMQDKLIAHYIHPLNEKLVLKEPLEQISKEEFDTLAAQLTNFYISSAMEHEYDLLYKPLMKIFFPEIIVKCKIYAAYMTLKDPYTILNDESKYNQAAARMKGALHFLQSEMSESFHERQGLIQLLEHNCAELDELANSFKNSRHLNDESKNSEPIQTITIEEIED
jgi:hypothetical protein